MPLVWDEVVLGLDPKQFHLRNALARVTTWPSDPCAPVLTERPDLAAALEALSAFAKD
jgi:DNA primase